MNSVVVPFAFREGIELRTIAEGEEILFVASDVAAILGYEHGPSMTRTLEDDEKGVRPVYTLGGVQSLTVISEPGLYKVILQRQTGRMGNDVTRETVKAFQRWVTHEVLPKIRRTGAYAVPTEPPTHAEALRGWADAIDQLTAAQETITELAPKADAFAHFLCGDRDYSVGDSAKMLVDEGVKTGERRLFETMHERGWLFRREGCWHLSQRVVEAGYGRMKPSAVTFTRSDGSIGTGRPQVRITARGLEALRRMHARDLAVVGS